MQYNCASQYLCFFMVAFVFVCMEPILGRVQCIYISCYIQTNVFPSQIYVICVTTVTMVIYLHPPLLFIFQLCLAFLFLYLNSALLMTTRIIAKASKYPHPHRSCLRMQHGILLFLLLFVCLFDQAILFIFP